MGVPAVNRAGEILFRNCVKSLETAVLRAHDAASDAEPDAFVTDLKPDESTKVPIRDDESRTVAVPIHDSADSGSGFGARVRSAMVWRSGSQILAQLITWGVTFYVLRKLDHGDYGLFAMTQTLMAMLSFLNGVGFVSSLIREGDVDRHRMRQAFGLLLALNGGLALIMVVTAPLVAAYYGEPQIVALQRVQALIFLAIPFIALPEVVMTRALDFRRQAIVNLIAALVGAGVSFVLARGGYGVWTLIWAPIAMFWTRAIGLTLLARLLVMPSFDWRGTGSMILFGGTLMMSHMMWLIQTQSDVVLAGPMLGRDQIGLYANGLFLTQIFVAKFVPPLNEVAYAAYARIQDDKPAVRWSFLKSVRLIVLIAAPAYLGMAATAAPLVEVAMGAKWLPIAPLVSVLAVAMLFNTVYVLLAPLCNALNQPAIPMRSSMIGAALFAGAFFVGRHWGPMGLALAWLMAAPLLLWIGAMLARPVAGIRVSDIARAAMPGVTAGIWMVIAVMLVSMALPTSWPVLVRLLALVATGTTVYVALLALFDRPAMAEVTRMVLRR